MRLQVKKWGNSASVRIPAAIMAAAEMQIDQLVDVREDHGRIVIEPVLAPVYDLDALLEKMTPDSFHDQVDFGASVGNEVW
jgi:antitoxin MazE